MSFNQPDPRITPSDPVRITIYLPLRTLPQIRATPPIPPVLSLHSMTRTTKILSTRFESTIPVTRGPLRPPPLLSATSLALCVTLIPKEPANSRQEPSLRLLEILSERIKLESPQRPPSPVQCLGRTKLSVLSEVEKDVAPLDLSLDTWTFLIRHTLSLEDLHHGGMRSRYQ
jgi:hypothetical protein